MAGIDEALAACESAIRAAVKTETKQAKAMKALAEEKHEEATKLRRAAAADLANVKAKTCALTDEINRLGIELRQTKKQSQEAQTRIGKLNAEVTRLNAELKATPVIKIQKAG